MSQTTIIAIGCLLLILMLVLLFYKGKKKQPPQIDELVHESIAVAEDEPSVLIEEEIIRDGETIEEVLPEANEVVIAPAAHRTNDFEKLVVTLFDPSIVRLVTWRSEHHANGVYPGSGTLPDMEWESLSPAATHPLFAVECKFRQDFRNNMIDLVSATELKNYRAFEQSHMPVFIILGVGGKAASPESIFVIPLRKLRANFITRNQLEPFREGVDGWMGQR